MKVILLCLIVVCSIFAVDEELRLISFTPEHREYVPKSKIQHLRLAGVNFIDLTRTPDAVYSPPGNDVSYPKEMKYEKEVKALFPEISSDNLMETITHLAESYPTRYFESENGVHSAHWIYSKLYKEFISTLPKERQERISIEEFEHEDFPQKSVICTFRGSSEEKQNELIVFGAHEDSVATDPLRAPGADDDASGVAAVFETFRILSSDKSFDPERTIQFQSYAAEEAGLLGSAGIAEKYKSENAFVYAMINIDMCSYHMNETNVWVGITTDYTSENLNKFVGQAIEKYTIMGYEEKKCGYACSDHASWNFFGYPSCFPFEAKTSPWIHSSSDSPEKVSLDMVVEYVKMSLGIAYELSMAN